jgi:hypothetical protein
MIPLSVTPAAVGPCVVSTLVSDDVQVIDVNPPASNAALGALALSTVDLPWNMAHSEAFASVSHHEVAEAGPAQMPMTIASAAMTEIGVIFPRMSLSPVLLIKKT